MKTTNNWIDDDQVIEALKKKNFDQLKKLNIKHCVSTDYKTCMYIRFHSAWEIPNEGWRDSNSLPSDNETGRYLLNITQLEDSEYVESSWYKIFIPLNLKDIELSTDGEYYIIKHQSGEIKGHFKNLSGLSLDFLTGNAEPEKEIEDKFKLLDN